MRKNHSMFSDVEYNSMTTTTTIELTFKLNYDWAFERQAGRGFW